ncbi:hypothetical protein HPB51_003708 [Rhipicephalus microplus]|uniref:Uncharacterized protein n=1 Tax=Rhipicephalus microplus TaxID=6941 RepID=A0A9J6E601_RHIMP|nr:hypothetical protein HPB51_003708 [Rhipicephalus microplus]
MSRANIHSRKKRRTGADNILNGTSARTVQRGMSKRTGDKSVKTATRQRVTRASREVDEDLDLLQGRLLGKQQQRAASTIVPGASPLRSKPPKTVPLWPRHREASGIACGRYAKLPRHPPRHRQQATTTTDDHAGSGGNGDIRREHRDPRQLPDTTNQDLDVKIIQCAE